MTNNYFYNQLVLIFYFLFILTAMVQANETKENETEEKVASDIRTLLVNKKIEEANQLALLHRDELEGGVLFDYVFGLLQRANGALNQAVFTFERVLQFKPNQVDSLYMLAVSYYELGNLDAAKSEFSKLTQLTLPVNIEQSVSSYLSSISRKQKQVSSALWNYSLQLGGGNDSNPNNGIVEEFITIPVLGDVRVFDENRQISSHFYDFNGRATVVSPVTQRSRWFATASVLRINFDDDLASSRTFVDTRLGYQQDIGQFKLSSSVYYQPIWLDGDSFLENIGVNLGVRHPLYRRASWGTQISYAQQTYTGRTLLNRDQVLGDLWVEAPLLGGVQRFSARYGDENAKEALDQDFIGREFFGFGYQWSKQISQQWGYKVSIDHLVSEYNGLNPLFASIRQDDFTRAELELRFKPSRQWLWLVKLTHVDNDSETPVFQYRRTIAWIGARYQF